MRKLFFVLAAAVLVTALAAPSFAATPKFTGVYRFRGVTAENDDKNDKAHDGEQFGDFLFRPRWTHTTEGGKVKGIYELDFDSGNEEFGGQTARPDVGVNRFIVDFLIPGTTLRARFGKSDWHTVDREVITSAGRNRIMGYGVYGKLWGPVSTSIWTVKYEEGGTAASDGDLWHASFTWKAAPAISITPYFMWDHNNGVSGTAFGSATTDIDVQYYAVNAKAKFGIADINVTGVLQDGSLDFSRGVNAGGIKDIDVDAWLALVRVWLTFGKLKVGFYGSWTSGDDDTTSAAGLFGRQPDSKLKRYFSPRNNGTGWIYGPQIITGRRYTTINPFGQIRDRDATGTGGNDGNGYAIYEAVAQYKLTKDLTLYGNVSIARSAAKRADLDTNWDGTVDTTYVNDKDIGTEIDVSARYYIYKSLWVQVIYAHLFMGDYGRSAATGTRDQDDAWAAYFEIRHDF